jgi:hypothetical protein
MGAFSWRGRARPSSEACALERSWAADACGRCGATLILGEGVVITGDRGRETLCFACASAPAIPVLSRARAGESGVTNLTLDDDSLDEAA